MNYRPTNYGNSYLDTNNNRLGYSSVSKGYGYSNRSNVFLIIFVIQIMEMMIKILDRYNLCYRMSVKNLNKQNKNMNMIQTMNEK